MMIQETVGEKDGERREKNVGEGGREMETKIRRGKGKGEGELWKERLEGRKK